MERPATGGELVRAAVLLRPAHEGSLEGDLAALAARPPDQRRHLGADELAARYGASPADLDLVKAFAAKHRLEVTAVNASGRLVELTGAAARFARAFRFDLVSVEHRGRAVRRPTHPVGIPPELGAAVEGIFGLDELPRFHRRQRAALAVPRPDRPAADNAPTAAPRTSSPPEVARRYGFPRDVDGTGQTIGIILLGGGFYEDDLAQFFGSRLPEISVVEVAGQKNDPAPRAAVSQFLDEMATGKQPTGGKDLIDRIWWTIEATVDLELAGSFAPGARLVAYFAPDDERGKIDALVAALTDREHDPAILSCSWSMRESDADASYLGSLDRLFQLAALRGIGVCYSSGDQGADPGSDGQPRVHFPASSPHVLSCGGTKLAPGSAPAEESAWNESRGEQILATGGGFSRHFPRPRWQRDAVSAPGGMRAVPDVAGKADYASGYACRLVGRPILGGGTSAAVPMWAGLLARLNQALGARAGWIAPLLYRAGRGKALEDIVEGGNGYFDAATGWDPCTGLGTPDGAALLRFLRGEKS